MRRILVACVLAATLLYAGICSWMFFKQDDLMYFPAQTRIAAADTGIAITRGNVVLRGWTIHSDDPGPILYFGGNAERIEHNRADFSQWFPGRSVYLVAYRGYGASDGEPAQEALFGDALAIYDQVRSLHPGQPISVIGRSLGSGIASYLATHRPVDRLALVTPYDSIENVAQSQYPWLPVHWLIRDRYPSADYLRGYRGQVLVLRAGHDQVISAESTQRLIEALPSKPREIVIAEARHDNISTTDTYAEALSAFMR